MTERDCRFACEWGVCTLDDGHAGIHGWNPATESIAYNSWRMIEEARAEDPMMEAEVALIIMQTPDRPEWLP